GSWCGPTRKRRVCSTMYPGAGRVQSRTRTACEAGSLPPQRWSI
ncbi:MAG: hypothetical protein AVDCRST_MAG31-265, partial [uncultured Sphingomonas sp.]